MDWLDLAALGSLTAVGAAMALRMELTYRRLNREAMTHKADAERRIALYSYHPHHGRTLVGMVTLAEASERMEVDPDVLQDELGEHGFAIKGRMHAEII